MKPTILPIRRLLLPGLLLCLLWLVVSQADAASWVVGLPGILLALYVYHRCSDADSGPLRIRLRAVPGFALWFLWQSLRGGIDVAWRALQPRVRLNPGFVRYRLSVPPGRARVFLVNCLSLLPGTLSADMEGDDLLVHALDAQAGIADDTRAIEAQVKRLYGLAGGSTHA
jgi:multicomponent Na+:H+ antiporter subunit E